MRDGGYFVTTGQQTGLFGGPLYTIYKALTAVRLARALEAVLERPVAPLFWVASTDHDWDEVNHVQLLDAENALHRLVLPADADAPPASTAHRAVGEGIEGVLDELERILPPSEFVPPLLERVRAAYSPGRSMASAFAELLADLLEPFDVVLVDPSTPALQALAAPVLRAEIEHAAENEDRLIRQTERLVAAGYHGQVTVGGGAVNVAYEDEEGRERLVRENGAFVLRRTKRRLTLADTLGLLESEPGRFSGTVLLRPVVESALFPTVAYVGGPSEVSYFAQTGCLFQAHGIEMPLVMPRASVTLVERKVRKVLDKFGLEPADFRTPARELATRIVRDELPPAAADAMRELRRAIQDGYDALTAATKAIDPTLKGPLTSARNASHAALKDVEKKLLTHLKEQNSTAVEQLDKAATNLYPSGAPQERVLNVLQYLGRYGPELLPAVAAALPMTLDRPAPDWSGVECGGGA